VQTIQLIPAESEQFFDDDFSCICVLKSQNMANKTIRPIMIREIIKMKEKSQPNRFIWIFRKRGFKTLTKKQI
jgi:hypothetical protein